MTDYRGFRMTTIYAITGIDDDDEECIPATINNGVAMPLIASDNVRLDSLIEMAKEIAN